MPFIKDKTGSMQTAVNAASAVVVAGLTTGAFEVEGDTNDERVESVSNLVNDLTDRIFAPLSAQVDEDNAKFAKAEAESESSGRKGGGGRASGGRKAPARRSTGRKGGGNKDYEDYTFDEAAAFVIPGGAFEGCTIEEVYSTSKSDADDYGYGKSGKEYIQWMSESDYPNAVVAAIFLDGIQAGN